MTEDSNPGSRATDQAAEPGSRLDALRRSAGLVVEMLQLRLELLVTDLEIEKLRLIAALTRIFSAILLGLLGFALLLAGLLMILPESWRWPVMLGSGVLCLLAAWLLARRAVHGLSEGGGPFAATRAELQRDREAL